MSLGTYVHMYLMVEIPVYYTTTGITKIKKIEDTQALKQMTLSFITGGNLCCSHSGKLFDHFW